MTPQPPISTDNPALDDSMIASKARSPFAVSVLVMTYNHSRYIDHALQSVLTQKLNVPYEILISEDCSTDNTREIIEGYAVRHPDKIRLILSEKNLRSNAVVSRGFHAARGRYVAMLDGDDFWLSEHKLQKQVDFMDSHPDYTICFHNASVVDADSIDRGKHWNSPSQKVTTDLTNIARGCYLTTSSTVYRRAAVPFIPEWYHEYFPTTDWPLHVLFSMKGKIGYLNEVMSAYRYHDEAWYSQKSAAAKLDSNLFFFQRIRKHVPAEISEVLRNGQREYFLEWAEEYARRGDIPMTWKCLRAAWNAAPYRDFRAFRRWACAAAGAPVHRLLKSSTNPPVPETTNAIGQ